MSQELNDILNQLGLDKTASEVKPTEDELIKAAASAVSTDEDLAALDEIIKSAEAEKKASDLELEGRFIARGFYAELKKLGEADGSHGSMLSVDKSVGDSEINAGGGGKPMSEGGGVEDAAAKDPSNVLQKIKGSLEAIHTPNSATAGQDSLEVVKKIRDAVVEQKAQAAEMETNL